ncbi:acetyltransferase [Mariannaea sp. PMI_226]|nr:acetyltransferase [Mariannaea sp. PMI_226]
MAQNNSDLLVELCTTEQDVIDSFLCANEAFGTQTQDGIWMHMNPGWDTPEGKTRAAQGFVKRWAGIENDNKGNPNTVFLKATLPDPARPGERVLVGSAIWVQASAVEGHGDPQAPRSAQDLQELYPEDEAAQRYAGQLDRSLHSRRVQLIKEIATTSQPAVMVLDMCAVDPAYQRRGIAKQLVQWGLDEAVRRGGLEAITEASSMGRGVYQKLGFQPQEHIVYDVDPEFADRKRPSNLFMRTRGP